MSIGFLAAIKAGVSTLTGRLTSGRATALDNLDATVSSRAASATALSSATWTAARAGYLDKIGIKSMQRGTIALAFSSGGTPTVSTATATLGTAVGTNAAICLHNGVAFPSGDFGAPHVRLELTSTTSVVAYGYRSKPTGDSWSAGTATAGFTVVEFNG